MASSRKQNLLKGTSPGKGSLLEKARRIFGRGAKAEDRSAKNEKERITGYHEELKKEKSGRAAPPVPAEASLYSKQEAAGAAPRAVDSGLAGKKEKKFSLSDIADFAKNQPWQGEKLIKTNLIQSEVVSFLDWSGRIKMLIACTAVPIGLILAAFVGLTLWDIRARTEAETLGGEIQSLNKRIEQAEANVKTVDLFKNKLLLAERLLDMHIYWTELFAFLENSILSDSVINGGFSGGLDGHYSFSITGRSYSDVIKQLNVLREKKIVGSAEIKQASLGGGKEGKSAIGVNYALNLFINPNIFLKGKQE